MKEYKHEGMHEDMGHMHKEHAAKKAMSAPHIHVSKARSHSKHGMKSKVGLPTLMGTKCKNG